MSRPNIRSRIAALLLTVGFAAHAQTPHPPNTGDPAAAPPRGAAHDARGEGGHRGPPPPTAELARALSLDETRAKALETILLRHRERVQALHRRTREGQDAIARDTDAELRRLLDARQYERFRAWRAEHRPPPGGPRGPGKHRPPPPGSVPPGGPAHDRRPHDGRLHDGRPPGEEG